MRTFLPSLALVLLAQIPLALKLWLDYRSKTSGFKQELYRRQLDAFQLLLAQLTPLNDDLANIVRAFPDSSLFDESDQGLKDTVSLVYKHALEAHLAFHKESIRADLLLPAELSLGVHLYTRGASRILECAMNMPTLRQSIRPDITKLWADQQERYNALLNLMRISVGIDALTSDVMRDVHANKRITAISTY